MRVALYARVSTKKQDLDSMIKVLTDWAARNEHEAVLYQDFAVSGRKDSRNGINQLLIDAEAGKFDLVGVVELSRVGRSIGFITSTIQKLQSLNIRVVLVNTNTIIDYSTIEGSAMVNALAMAADIEWRLIQDRNARGRQAIKDKNIVLGRHHVDVSLEAIKALKEKGMSLREIAVELNVSAPTIMRRMRVVS